MEKIEIDIKKYSDFEEYITDEEKSQLASALKEALIYAAEVDWITYQEATQIIQNLGLRHA